MVPGERGDLLRQGEALALGQVRSGGWARPRPPVPVCHQLPMEG